MNSQVIPASDLKAVHAFHDRPTNHCDPLSVTVLTHSKKKDSKCISEELSRRSRSFSRDVCRKQIEYYDGPKFINEVICENEVYKQMLFKKVCDPLILERSPTHRPRVLDHLLLTKALSSLKRRIFLLIYHS